ncbi:MAG: hypothetical protein QM758_28325 [Armatimonas sp.]
MPQPKKTTTETTPPEKKNPNLASIGNFATEPMWDALQEEMQKFRKERDAAVDSDTAPTHKAA